LPFFGLSFFVNYQSKFFFGFLRDSSSHSSGSFSSGSFSSGSFSSGSFSSGSLFGLIVWIKDSSYSF